MTELLGRKVRLQIQTLDVSDLDIDFRIARDLSDKPNTATIRVFNLNATSRRTLEKANAPLAELSAGYSGALSKLFSGTVDRPVTISEGPDLITTIEASDGGPEYQTKRVSKSFPMGTPAATVVNALAAATGLKLGNVPMMAATALATHPGGTTAHGPALAEMRRHLAGLGLTVSVQSGALQIVKSGVPVPGVAALLSPDTGLVSSPSVDRDGTVSLRCLISPNLEPGRPIMVQSASVRGLYQITETTYTGSTFGPDWFADLKAKAV